MFHIAIAEDKPRLSAALRADLGLFQDVKVTGVFPDGRAIVDGLKALPHLPDLIFMDIEMPRLDGIQATEAIKEKYPQVRILMLTVFEDEDNLFRAIQAGADGYLLKGAAPKELYKALRQATDGGAPMSPLMARKTLKLLARSPVPSSVERAEDADVDDLSARETEVLEHLAAGLKYKDIATNLFLSEGTIRKHVEKIYRKLRVNNKVRAVAKAKRLGHL